MTIDVPLVGAKIYDDGGEWIVRQVVALSDGTILLYFGEGDDYTSVPLREVSFWPSDPISSPGS